MVRVICPSRCGMRSCPFEQFSSPPMFETGRQQNTRLIHHPWSGENLLGARPASPGPGCAGSKSSPRVCQSLGMARPLRRPARLPHDSSLFGPWRNHALSLPWLSVVTPGRDRQVDRPEGPALPVSGSLARILKSQLSSWSQTHSGELIPWFHRRLLHHGQMTSHPDKSGSGLRLFNSTWGPTDICFPSIHLDSHSLANIKDQVSCTLNNTASLNISTITNPNYPRSTRHYAHIHFFHQLCYSGLQGLSPFSNQTRP